MFKIMWAFKNDLRFIGSPMIIEDKSQFNFSDATKYCDELNNEENTSFFHWVEKV